MTDRGTSPKEEVRRSEAAAYIRHVLRGYSAVWAIDFEYEVTLSLPVPVVLVATDLISGRTFKRGPGEFGQCPFRCDGSELFIAFYAVAEASCFLALGWPLPPRWLDLWAEARRLNNGRGGGNGLLDVMGRFRLPVRDSGQKKAMQILVGEGNWHAADIPAILAYCEEDVRDTELLAYAMMPLILSEAPDASRALPQAIIRGTFVADCALIERIGVPVDVNSFNLVRERWPEIRQLLIADVNTHYGVFQGDSFSAKLFGDYLAREQIPWPRLTSGALQLDDDTFRQRAKSEPRIALLRECRVALSQLRGNDIQVDADGRVRTPLRPLASKTGRCQPSTSKFLFGAARWTRSFIMAPPGHTFAYLDYKSQEIGIAAYLSGDQRLVDAYSGGDPYIGFAKTAKLVPADATKESHPVMRAACKAIVLGVQYGMSAEGMAAASGVSLDTCRELLLRHHETYHGLWRFVQSYRDRLAAGHRARPAPSTP